MKDRVGENLYKYKKGISLIVLLITIVVALILIATVIISTDGAIDNANVNVFANDLSDVQDATESYYITNNVMPTPDSTPNALTKDDILASSSNTNLLTNELIENNDLDAEFYAIDLAKINVTKISYGNGSISDGDVFVVAYPSMDVYYLLGLNAKGTTFYSLTSKLFAMTKIPRQAIDTSSTSIISSGGIKVTKNNSVPNKMGITIDTTMAADEQLFMSVSGDVNRLITTSEGNNTFKFDTLSGIVNKTEDIQVPELTQVEADYIEKGTKPPAERYVDILKYKSSELIGKVRIDLSAYTDIMPVVSDSSITSYSTMNALKLSFANNDSSIKDVYYEYLTKFADDGTIQSYYSDISDYDAVYMQTKAKKAVLSSDLTTTINAPKNIQSIKIAVVDKSGNVNLYNEQIAPNLYVGYSLDYSTSNNLQLTAKVYSGNGVKSIDFSLSTDGLNFTNHQLYTLNNTTNGISTQQCNPYTGISTSNAYVKIVAINYDNSITESRIVRINVATKSFGIGDIATETRTFNGGLPKYNNPIVPKGFMAINSTDASWYNVSTDWNKGLVIQDASGNQFVWVPVDGVNVPYAKWCTRGTSYTATSDDTLPSGVSSETNQIIKYGGFYVARYEAGKESTSTVVSKKLASDWANINYTDAKAAAESMYNTSDVKSGLITGTEWDTVLKWIENSGKSSLDSRNWGNYSNSIAPANVTGYSQLQATGFSEYWKANNIYDIAGNLLEWTNELAFSSSDGVSRGGYYVASGLYTDSLSMPASERAAYSFTTYYPSLTFRVALYVL